MGLLRRPWLFELGSSFYAWFTANSPWRQSCAFLASYFPPPAKQHLRVLDLGCGPGVTAITLARVRPDALYVGVDLARRMIHIAQTDTAKAGLDGSITYVVADAHALPFAEGTFDATVAHSFLYLVPNREGVLREAFRVLRRGGRYASMEPRDGKITESALKKHWRDIRYVVSVLLWRPYSKYHGRLNEKNFPEALEQAGFQVTGTETVLGGYGIVGYGEKQEQVMKS